LEALGGMPENREHRNESERLQRENLTRMRRFATLILVMMSAVFLVTKWLEKAYPELSWIRAFAEAAMVGGLADWFAVTALFKRPLGLPIPHTAIIPANKERVAGTMGRFIQKNFLSEEVLGQKLQQLDIASRMGLWLEQPENARKA